jgi:hypothetical protein
MLQPQQFSTNSYTTTVFSRRLTFYLISLHLWKRLSLSFWTAVQIKPSWLCDQLSVGQFILVSGTPLGPMTRFFLSLPFLRQLLCSYLGRPLWREDGSVICGPTKGRPHKLTVYCTWSARWGGNSHSIFFPLFWISEDYMYKKLNNLYTSTLKTEAMIASVTSETSPISTRCCNRRWKLMSSLWNLCGRVSLPDIKGDLCIMSQKLIDSIFSIRWS